MSGARCGEYEAVVVRVNPMPGACPDATVSADPFLDHREGYREGMALFFARVMRSNVAGPSEEEREMEQTLGGRRRRGGAQRRMEWRGAGGSRSAEGEGEEESE